jgi:hypothetical protein
MGYISLTNFIDAQENVCAVYARVARGAGPLIDAAASTFSVAGPFDEVFPLFFLLYGIERLQR